MATAIARTPTSRPPQPCLSSVSSIKTGKFLCSVSFRQSRRHGLPKRFRIYHSLRPSSQLPPRLVKFLPFASNGDAAQTTETDTQEQVLEPELEENLDGAAVEEATAEGEAVAREEPTSAILALLRSYKEAFASNDESKVAEIEAFLKSIEDEKINLERKVATLTEELSYEKDRVLRISADFDNFRKRTERERLSIVTNAQGEVVERLLPVLDNFERAQTQIKVETEGEEKIKSSYQNICKQFVEILGSLGVVPVETVGNPFDPLLHEAIMREDSTEFEEGVVIEEYRKGFKLGDRLLRPSMVKVSAGPGPGKSETTTPTENLEDLKNDGVGGSAEPEGVSDTSE